MSKQSLLEEFDKQFPRFACSDDYECPTVRTIGENPDKAFDGDVLLDGETVIRDSLKQFLSKAIDQTREETIKEILSQLRDPRQKMCWDYYINPKSKTFGNAYRSALKAGYEENTLKLRNTYKAEDIADTAFLTESDLESVLNK